MVRLPSIGRRIRNFVRLGAERRALLIEAAAWLLGARLALFVVPFPSLARRFGTFVLPTDHRVVHAPSLAPIAHRELARRVGWAVTQAARHVPFRAVCLPQAMAARIMLERRGIASILHFGAIDGEQAPFEAHAWLDAAGVPVTGERGAAKAVEIGCFV